MKKIYIPSSSLSVYVANSYTGGLSIPQSHDRPTHSVDMGGDRFVTPFIRYPYSSIRVDRWAFPLLCFASSVLPNGSSHPIVSTLKQYFSMRANRIVLRKQKILHYSSTSIREKVSVHDETGGKWCSCNGFLLSLKEFETATAMGFTADTASRFQREISRSHSKK